jgi:hypothetical protein
METSRISHDNGLFAFPMDSRWSHQIEDDGTQVFWHPPSGSGTLRVSSLTAKKIALEGSSPAADAWNKSGSICTRADGVASTHYQVTSKERGKGTVMLWWEFSQFLAPQYLRIALFSFTIWAEELGARPVVRQIEQLQDMLEQIQFGPLQEYEK